MVCPPPHCRDYAFGPDLMSASLILAALPSARVIYGFRAGAFSPPRLPAWLIPRSSVGIQRLPHWWLRVWLASIVGPLFAAVLIGFGFGGAHRGRCALILISSLVARAIPTKTRATESKVSLFALPQGIVTPYPYGPSRSSSGCRHCSQRRGSSCRIGWRSVLRLPSSIEFCLGDVRRCSFFIQALVVPVPAICPTGS